VPHPSYPSVWATVPCYHRLEFLGDSLLDMVCVEDLFARYPYRDPQWLTEHKVSYMVSCLMEKFADMEQMATVTNKS
jgi:endoribonuclease Dicer